jgi:hypothetical protein
MDDKVIKGLELVHSLAELWNDAAADVGKEDPGSIEICNKIVDSIVESQDTISVPYVVGMANGMALLRHHMTLSMQAELMRSGTLDDLFVSSIPELICSRLAQKLIAGEVDI